MSGYRFKNIEKLKRNREIEGTIGTPVHFKKVGVTFQVLAATDANPRWRQFGDDYLNEYRRLQRAGADEARITKFLAENITRMFVIGWPVPPVHDDDTPVPFSTEACVAYLTEADDVIPAILAVVGETSNYRGEAVEIVSGELKKLISWDDQNAGQIKGWQALAKKGDAWAVDRLLSRPDPSAEAMPYWLAFLDLSRDRPTESLSMGMAGGLSLQRPVPRETIRREGRRLGYRGADLEDFVLILTIVDDFYVEVAVKRAAEDMRRSVDRGRSRHR